MLVLDNLSRQALGYSMNDLSNLHQSSDKASPQYEVVGVFGVPNNKTQNIDDGLVEYADALEAIDENKASAKLNEISMIDNMGRRIYY